MPARPLRVAPVSLPSHASEGGAVSACACQPRGRAWCRASCRCRPRAGLDEAATHAAAAATARPVRGKALKTAPDRWARTAGDAGRAEAFCPATQPLTSSPTAPSPPPPLPPHESVRRRLQASPLQGEGVPLPRACGRRGAVGDAQIRGRRGACSARAAQAESLPRPLAPAAPSECRRRQRADCAAACSRVQTVPQDSRSAVPKRPCDARCPPHAGRRVPAARDRSRLPGVRTGVTAASAVSTGRRCARP